MSKFCNSMNNYSNMTTMNEKGCKSYSKMGVSRDSSGKLNDDLGLISLDFQLIRDNNDIESLYGEVYRNILNNLDNVEDRVKYMSYLIKLIFKTRDVQDGNGERMLFYKLLLKLNETYSDLVCNCLDVLTGGYDENGKMVKMGKPYGSFLDLNNIFMLCSENESPNNNKLKERILDYISFTLLKDKDADIPTLCAKWLPREKKMVDKKTGFCLKLAKKMNNPGFSNKYLYKNYRNVYSDICKKLKIVETKMANNLWDEIEIKEVPSKAFMKYLKAFKYENKDGSIREPYDEERLSLREKVLTEQKVAIDNPEEAVINTQTLMPNDIVGKLFQSKLTYSDIESYNALWNKYVCDFKKSFSDGLMPPGVVLADVSLSMAGTPLNVCLALSIILSDLFEGPYKNKVITFESNPRWHDIKGELLTDKLYNLKNAPWGGNTNFSSALDMILDVGVKNKLNNDEMPKVLYIFSDMQWNQADRNATGFEDISKMYKKYDYEMPHIVFWNLRATNTYNNNSKQDNTTMMSGFSPNLFKSFMNGNFIESTPWNTLKELLDSKRYEYLNDKINKYI